MPLSSTSRHPQSAPVHVGDPQTAPESPVVLKLQVQPKLTPKSHVWGAGSSAQEAFSQS